jgi:O-succinylbenzoate synthase
MAKAGVEMGMWGLGAELASQPLSRYIGGTREVIDVGISLGIQATPELLVKQAKAALDEGYRKIKIKIAPGSDFAYLKAAREALGPDAPIMADANNAYTLADTKQLQKLDDLNLMMIEQPLASDDIVRHAELQRALKTPVCLDESITGLDRAEDMVTLGSGRIINIKAGRVGGFGPSIDIHDFCLANNVPVWCGGMFESGIGRAYNVAIASLPGFTKPGDVSPSARYWHRDIVTPEWTMDSAGHTRVPLDRPGIGVEVDVERIESLTVRSTTFVS